MLKFNEVGNVSVLVSAFVQRFESNRAAISTERLNRQTVDCDKFLFTMPPLCSRERERYLNSDQPGKVKNVETLAVAVLRCPLAT